MTGRRKTSGARGYWWVAVAYVLVGAALAGLPDPQGTADAKYPWTATHLLGVSRASTSGVSPVDQLTLAQLAFFATAGEVPTRAARELGFDGDPDDFADEISVTADRNSGALRLTTVQSDPARAVAIADTFAAELVGYLTERDAELQRDRLDAGVERLAQLGADLADAEQLLGVDPTDPVALTEVDRLRGQYSVTFEQVSLLGSGEAGLRITTLEPATAIPVADAGLAAPRNRAARALTGGLAGLAIGVGIALLLARAERKIRSVVEVEELMATAVAVVVPDRRRSEFGSLAVTHDRHDQLADAMRTLSRVVLSTQSGRLPDDGAPVIVVTSPGRSDGRTSIAADLGAAFAELRPGVIVANGDFRQPAVARLLTARLRGTVPPLDPDQLEHASPEQLIHPTDHAGLSVVDLAGTRRMGPVELAQATARLLERTRLHASAIVVDTAALTAAAESLDLIGIADVVLLVIRLGHTTKADAARALELIRSVSDAAVLPVVTGGAEGSSMEEYPTPNAVRLPAASATRR